MAASPSQIGPVFRPSMLLYDSRYRSITIQIVVLLLVMAGIGWLLHNLFTNLAQLGRTLDFDFLGRRAGYEITPSLIQYSADNTHWRALVVGLLNTLLVALVGCILATIVGVLVGVLRLSNNWLVGRLMTVYVEVFRNIPVLLWILMLFAVLKEATPAPNAYRLTPAMVEAGQSADASMFLGSFAVTNRYTTMPTPLLSRGPGGIDLGFVNFSGGFLILALILIASILAVRYLGRRATRIQAETGKRPTTWWQSLLILFVPVILALWAMGFYIQVPEITSFNFSGGIQLSNGFVALTLALALYTGAFIAEIVRAGILAVSRGQSEAAFALGLRPGWTMRLVILPQALRVIVPPLISQYLNLTKNSSLALAASYLDLRGTLGGITLNQTGRGLECMLLLMAIYLIISLLISSGMNVFNSRVRLKER
ncbi:amino acid ABC transporter permease [Pseudoroseicyclus aestuarii]|uniref:L-glutamine ABC transporter membrane protein /L-glutamate ABC transporter membrane protein /L-aspartate ABC transporter membrane protein /L-asparagine ABC transporter membrane protein n=1 Tax=Pseudoroseicyclus aestuarii TaxID=1795041 RepID=A0A318SUA6_9RHOB|nr:ABC transporter permease subunit [Pseudoroseicyclus aestuarii]PYE84945.1 L-glutamine ABC transporter membrane protein /L-glutamate ABC transporter membrane protein /L-aspartate ABC transporter membrane protein /L-asparagine ABC transporter membrane protein [Pseudoroseicyclus aestuarii]